jgi:O-antigen ligase
MSKALKKEGFSIWGLLLAIFVFLAPLESFLIIQTGSLLKFYTIACIYLFGAKILVKGKIKKLTSAQVCLVFFITIIALSAFWSPHMSRGVDILFSMGLQVVFLFVAVQVDYNQAEKKSLLMVYVLSSVILSFLVFANADMILAEGGRATAAVPDGSNIDPNNIAAYLVGGFAVLINIDTRSKLLKIGKLVLQILFIVATFMTVSRGAFVALIVIILYNAFNKGKLRRTIFFVLTMLLLFGVVYALSQYIFGDNNPVLLLMQRFSEDESGSGRLQLWEVSFNEIVKRPILGYGLGESPYVIGRKLIADIGSHNTFVTIWFEAGIFALISFILMLILLFKERRKDVFDYSVYGMLLSALTSSFFIDSYNKKILWLPVMLCMIASVSNRHQRLAGNNQARN